jgi:hypothetical protein
MIKKTKLNKIFRDKIQKALKVKQIIIKRIRVKINKNTI